MGERTNGWFFKFSNEDQITKFMNLYGDLFKPYCEERVRSESYNRAFLKGRKWFNYDGAHDPELINFARRGVARTTVPYLVQVNLTSENFRTILKSGLFLKVRDRRYRFWYVFQD